MMVRKIIACFGLDGIDEHNLHCAVMGRFVRCLIVGYFRCWRFIYAISLLSEIDKVYHTFFLFFCFMLSLLTFDRPCWCVSLSFLCKQIEANCVFVNADLVPLEEFPFARRYRQWAADAHLARSGHLLDAKVSGNGRRSIAHSFPQEVSDGPLLSHANL